MYADWIVRAAQRLVWQYGVQIAAIIPETTERWGAEEASRRAELARRGEVYSFIRINGSPRLRTGRVDPLQRRCAAV